MGNFPILENRTRSYHIQAVTDSIQGVCFRRNTKSRIDDCWDWWMEAREIETLTCGALRIFCTANCTDQISDDETLEPLEKILTTLQRFTHSVIDLTQPGYSFLIHEIKYIWRERWWTYNLGCIQSNK